MFIILKENIRKLGVTGDLVKVNGGYARNYLIPEKKAVIANDANRAELKRNKVLIEEKNAELLVNAKKVAESMKGISLVVECKANPMDGKLFGSVNSRDIVKDLKSRGINIAPRDIVMGQIKKTGEYTIEVAVHTEVIVKLPLEVKPIKDDSSL